MSIGASTPTDLVRVKAYAVEDGDGPPKGNKKETNAMKRRREYQTNGFTAWYGVCFSKYSTDEISNLLGMQSMFGTIGSLVAGIAVSLFSSQQANEVADAVKRLEDMDCPTLAAQVSYGAAWCAAISCTAAMFTVFLSLFLYVALSAANFPQTELCEDVVQRWVLWHYPLLAFETFSLLIAVGFVWGTMYYIGAVKFDVNCMTFGFFGLFGLCFLFLIFPYVGYVHFKKTIKYLKIAHDMGTQDALQRRDSDE